MKTFVFGSVSRAGSASAAIGAFPIPTGQISKRSPDGEKRNPGQASPSIPDFALRNPGYARSFPAHAGIQSGSPRSRGEAEIYGLLCNSHAAVQPRKDSQKQRKP
jgi:hypothetical protein